MQKKEYAAPMLLGPITPVDPTTVPYGPSQGEYDDETTPAEALEQEQEQNP